LLKRLVHPPKNQGKLLAPQDIVRNEGNVISFLRCVEQSMRKQISSDLSGYLASSWDPMMNLVRNSA